MAAAAAAGLPLPLLLLLLLLLPLGAAGARNDAGRLTAGGQLVMLQHEQEHEATATATATAAGKKRYFVDAGSTGSKMFGYCGAGQKDFKLETKCKRDLSEGIAALQYDQGAKCDGAKWQLNDGGGDLASAAAYAERLLGQSRRPPLSELAGDCPDGVDATVPILATAGMRLLSAAKNKAIWDLVCGKPSPKPTGGSGLAFAAAGKQCGTIPGTVEAYYEFLAFAGLPSALRKPAGIFSMGGASAQIAVPLVSEEDVTNFRSLIGTVKAGLDCTALKVPGGEDAPVFSDPPEGTAKKEACVGDYIAIREFAEMKGLSDDEKVSAGWAKRKGGGIEPAVQGVGLVSFLALRGAGLLAGGAKEVQKWATANGCGAPGSLPFAECRTKLIDELDKDVLWKSVTAYFKAKKYSIQDFSYNTNSAVPSKSFDKDDANVGGGTPKPKDAVGGGQDQAWKLADEVAKQCAPGAHGPDWGFGFKQGATCTGAYFVALYTTAFFAPEQQGQLQYNPAEVPWSDGAVRVPGGALLEADDAAAAAAAAEAMLHLPLRRHSASYAEGAVRYLAAAAAEAE